MNFILAIAAGGAIGAIGRHYAGVIALKWLGAGFPFGTLFVNVTGSFVMGALIALMSLRWTVGDEVRAFLTVGLMGGFTTFSAFSLDFVTPCVFLSIPLQMNYFLVTMKFHSFIMR